MPKVSAARHDHCVSAAPDIRGSSAQLGKIRSPCATAVEHGDVRRVILVLDSKTSGLSARRRPATHRRGRRVWSKMDRRELIAR
eukprot:CAMPEP_0174912330 /NCGR_PEP_ID=MMETSP0167-20121228/79728_1 /TAXON_ID=38298 /ORGANISM="Rhodella maculata, Strain CCMP736" /LENGTH=83 /DNA_ID=CAMNT_0016156975 /DNA_START=1221 /DNA_END=1469 /DNA_ORIENTATION=-